MTERFVYLFTIAAICTCATLGAALIAFIAAYALRLNTIRLWTQLKNNYALSLVTWEIKRLHKRGAIDYFLKDADRTLPEDAPDA